MARRRPSIEQRVIPSGEQQRPCCARGAAIGDSEPTCDPCQHAKAIAIANLLECCSSSTCAMVLGIDDLGGAFFGIDNRNYHDRKSLFYRGPGS